MNKLLNKYSREWLDAQFEKKGWSQPKLQYIWRMYVYCFECGDELIPKCLNDEHVVWPGWCNKACQKAYIHKSKLSKPRKCRRCKSIYYAVTGRCCEQCTEEISYTECKKCGLKFKFRTSKNAKKIDIKYVPPYCFECRETQAPNKGTIPELCVEGMLQNPNVTYITQWADHNIWDDILKRRRRFRPDFYLPEQNVIIEADGDYWHGSEEKQLYDLRRDELFSTIGITTHRFWENEIKSNPFEVEKKIKTLLSTK